MKVDGWRFHEAPGSNQDKLIQRIEKGMLGEKKGANGEKTPNRESEQATTKQNIECGQ